MGPHQHLALEVRCLWIGSSQHQRQIHPRPSKIAAEDDDGLHGGIVLYDGGHTLPLCDDRLRSVLLSEGWEW